jgi:hypothetical protein
MLAIQAGEVICRKLGALTIVVGCTNVPEVTLRSGTKLG